MVKLIIIEFVDEGNLAVESRDDDVDIIRHTLIRVEQRKRESKTLGLVEIIQFSSFSLLNTLFRKNFRLFN